MPSIEKLAYRSVVSLNESTTCADAAFLLEQRRLGCVGVTRNGKLIGIVTERDLVYGVMAHQRPSTITIGEVTRTDAPAVPPNATDVQCAKLMQTHARRHLLVKEGDEIVGVISMLDVLSLMLEDERFLVEQLETFIQGGRG